MAPSRDAARQTMLEIFGAPRALIGMVHLRALPGSPNYRAPFERVVEVGVQEAMEYRRAGFHALMVENMHDRPYLPRGRCGPETVAAMAAAAREIRRAVELPLGVQVLAGANREALAVAAACGAQFARVEGFVFAHVADEGLLEADAGELLRYRVAIGAEKVRIFADIKKKHSSHAITADLDLAETARAAEFCQADGVIVTGVSTGRETIPSEVEQVAAAVTLPVFVGSGVAVDNLARYPQADACIVGSWVKRGGHWSGELDPERVRELSRAFRDMFS
ncbi:MAG: BtpA/SgcQ family protein [Armatimonadetes bacterium]|nr:BtpA/SgcQ family protein [Armatimonadota bacterium]